MDGPPWDSRDLSGRVGGADLTAQFPFTWESGWGGGSDMVTAWLYNKRHEWTLLTAKSDGPFSVLLDSVWNAQLLPWAL